MKAFICEMCGSQNLVKQDDMYVCQNCGTKYGPEEAKKLLVEVSGEVKVNNKEKIENYRVLARRARNNDNALDAAKYYDLIRAEEPNDWESSFFSVYYQAIQTRVMNVITYTDTLVQAAFTSIQIADTMLEQEDVESAATTILQYFNIFCEAAFETCVKGFTDSWPHVSESYTNEHLSRIINLHTRLFFLGTVINESFANKPAIKKLSLIPYKESINIAYKFDVHYVGLVRKKTNLLPLTENAISKVKETEPLYQPPIFPSTSTSSTSSGGCYVATAIYGSYDCAQVWTLRRYRDYILAATWYGRAFIALYYMISPTLIKWFGQTEWFKKMWKPTLDKMIKRLNMAGVSNTPYVDKEW